MAEKIAEDYVRPKGSTNPLGQIVYLTERNFAELTNNSDWLIMFHAPWCGHCKTLAPTWVELAKKMKGKINVGKVDCTTETKLANRYGIRGYPTIKYVQEPFNKVDYKGRRSLLALEEFANGFIRYADKNLSFV